MRARGRETVTVEFCALPWERTSCRRPSWPVRHPSYTSLFRAIASDDMTARPQQASPGGRAALAKVAGLSSCPFGGRSRRSDRPAIFGFCRSVAVARQLLQLLTIKNDDAIPLGVNHARPSKIWSATLTRCPAGRSLSPELGAERFTFVGIHARRLNNDEIKP